MSASHHRGIKDARPRRKLDTIANALLLPPLVRALRMPYFGRLSVIMSVVALLVIAALAAHGTAV
jgi:hypothetical protein